MFRTDTIAAVATPPGEGGIAVVRVSGPATQEVASRLFRPRRGGDARDFPGYSVHYGDFMDSTTGDTVDDGLLTLFRAPRSYTGENMAELSCHGGRAVVARLLQLALNAGARLAEPGEFTQRAFLNGKLDLAQAEAVSDLIRAKTDSARRLARRQLEGELSREVARLKDDLVGILAAIEVTIDFSDEVGDLEYDPLVERIRTALTEIETLLSTTERGRILREGLKITIVGRPNVGKSSLLNALLRADRAIVTDIPGTTRDVIEETAQIDGVPLVLTDTAGLRETEDVVERIGVARTHDAMAQSDVLLFVLDATTGLTLEDTTLLNNLTTLGTNLPILIVANKSDALPPRASSEPSPDQEQKPDRKETIPHCLPSPFQGEGLGVRVQPPLPISALTGEGIPQLEARLRHIATQDSHDSVLVANVRHSHALTQARDSLKHALETTLQGLPGDFIAIDVRGALDALGLITGETVTEDIIHRIFQDFCVGK